MAKVQAMRERIGLIHPRCTVHGIEEFVEPDNWPQLLPSGVQAVIDACDAVMDKIGKPRGLINYTTSELYAANVAGKNEHWSWRHLIRPVLHIDERATLTQLLALFLDKAEIAVLVDQNGGDVSGWITMDDVMKVLMGQRI